MTVVAGVGGHGIGKGQGRLVVGTVTNGMNADIPAQIVATAEVAPQIGRVEAVEVPHDAFAHKWLKHPGGAAGGTAVDGHFEGGEAEHFVAEPTPQSQVGSAVVELGFDFFFTEAVPRGHQRRADFHFAVAMGCHVGPHFPRVQARLLDAGDTV